MYTSEHIITSKHYLVLLSAAFAAGIFAAAANDISLFVLLAAFPLITLFVFGLILPIFFKKRPRPKNIVLPSALLLFLLLGAFRIQIAETAAFNPLLRYNGSEAWLYGTVAGVPQITSSKYYCAFELDVVQVNSDKSAKGTVLTYIPADRLKTVQAGATVCCWARLSVPEEIEHSDSFDYHTRLKGKNIFLTANIQNINLTDLPVRQGLISRLRAAGLSLRVRLSKTIDRLFFGDAEAAAILKGILLGDKSGFTDEMYIDFANSGISHIVAVSGLHISILFSALTLIFGSLGFKRSFSAAFSLPFILLFVSVSAFSHSACRAALMLLVTALSFLFSERYDPITSLFFSLGIILAVSPYAILSKSLLLSFFSTLGIFVYFKYLNSLFCRLIPSHAESNKPLNRFVRTVLKTVASSFALTSASVIGTAFLIVLFFSKLSRVQFITNLWVVPLVSVLFCLGYIVCILALFPQLVAVCNLVKAPLKITLKIIKLTVHCFGDQRFALNIPPQFISIKALIIYIGSALMLYFFLKALCDIKTQAEIAAKSRSLSS